MPETNPIIALEKENIQNNYGCDYNAGNNWPILHRHEFFEITFFFSRTKHFLNGRTTWIRENTLLFIRPDDTHCFTNCAALLGHVNVKVSQAYMRTICDYIDGDFYQLLLSAEDSQLSIPLSEDYGRTVHKFLDGLLTSQGSKTIATSCKFMVVSFLKLIYQHMNTITKATTSETVQQIMLLLQKSENFSANITDLLSSLGYSYMQIYRLFKESTGQTPNAFFTECKLQYASNLLTYTSYKIIDIAGLCGFATQARFDTAFKKRYGVSPREYRKTHIPIRISSMPILV